MRNMTDEMLLEAIGKAKETMKRERPFNAPDDDKMSVYEYIEAGIKLLNNEEVQISESLGGTCSDGAF